MQIPILNGIYSDQNSDLRVAYPRNMIPVPLSQGVSGGYLRPAEGITEFATGPGADKGGINWNGIHYRVMGTKLVRINVDSSVNEIGTVEIGDYARFDYSFDRLSISIGGKLYYWDDTTFQQVTDPDLGFCVDHIWIDGYFMSTDGEFIVVTDIGNPLSVNPLKYGSSEIDPDPIVALLEIRNEAYVVNRYTIEVFDNVGGTQFPFQRINGGQITKGAVGTRACCVFLERIAFIGSGKNEDISIYLGINGQASRISTREIDIILEDYTEATLANILLESRITEGHAWLYIHLPDKTLVYDAASSQALNQPVWFVLTSGFDFPGQYLAQNFVKVNDKWYCGHPTLEKVGYFDKNTNKQWDELTNWDITTGIIYNESNGAIFHELELIALNGRQNLNEEPLIYTQYSIDGIEYSQRRYINAGKIGESKKRLIWLNQGHMRNWRVQKFGGNSDTKLSILRLEARIEPLLI